LDARTAIAIGLYSGVIPAATAFVVCLVLGRLLPDGMAARYALAVSFALGVLTGFLVARPERAFLPSDAWDWVPYVGLMAAIVAGTARAHRITLRARSTMYVLIAGLAAWLIVPQWEDMTPPRTVQMTAVAVAIFALALSLEPLAKRLPGQSFAVGLMLSAAASAIFVLAEVSETFGRLAALPASALAGCSVAALLNKRNSDVASLALPYAVMVGGYAYTAAMYPTPPMMPVLLTPFAPLALWISLWGRLRGLTGARAVILQMVCALLPLAIIAAVLVVGSAGDEW
jgi:hypothetical protein